MKRDGTSGPTGADHAKLSRALEKLEAALAMLDECGAPAEIGAELDLARARLEHYLGGREDGD